MFANCAGTEVMHPLTPTFTNTRLFTSKNNSEPLENQSQDALIFQISLLYTYNYSPKDSIGCVSCMTSSSKNQKQDLYEEREKSNDNNLYITPVHVQILRLKLIFHAHQKWGGGEGKPRPQAYQRRGISLIKNQRSTTFFILI